MRTTFTFRSAGNLVFGRNAVRELGGILDRAGAKRVFVVTDKILARVGIVDQAKSRRPATESSTGVNRNHRSEWCRSVFSSSKTVTERRTQKKKKQKVL